MSTTEGTPPEIPNNATGPRIPEALLRQFITYQLGQIAARIDDPDVTFIEELFSSHGPGIVKQLKDWFREHPNIPVTINYPRQDIGLPFISVVNGSENEDEGGQYMDDHVGIANYGVLGGGTAIETTSNLQDPGAGVPQYTREVKSVPYKHSTLIYVASMDVNLTMYLYAIVKALLIVNKFDFDKYGDMRDLVISGRDLEFHPELFPEFAYFKVISLMYNTNFDIPLAPQRTVIGGVDVSLRVATQFTLAMPGVEEDIGPATITEVPSE